MSRARSLANLANSGVFSADATTSRVGINSSAPERTLDVVGDGRVSGTLSIGGTINYEDVTSIDSIGVVTARDGVHVVSAGASIYSPANNELALYTNSSERVRITSDGNLGIGLTNPTSKLEIYHALNRIHQFSYDDNILSLKGANNSGNPETLRFIGGNNLIFNTGTTGSGTEKLRITSAGKIGIGTALPREVNLLGTSSSDSAITIEGTSLDTSIISLIRNENNTNGSYLVLAKSRGTQVGSYTSVRSGDDLGVISFGGFEDEGGTNGAQPAAYIKTEVDREPWTAGSSHLPGKISIHVGPDSNSNPTERLRIDSDGRATFISDPGILIKTSTDSAGAGISFSDYRTGDEDQYGDIRFYYQDGNTLDGEFGSMFRIDATPEAKAIPSGSSGNRGGMLLDVQGSAIIHRDLVVGYGTMTTGVNNVSTQVPLFVGVQASSTVAGDAGAASKAYLRISDFGTNNNYYHGIDIRNRNSGDIRILNEDVNASNTANMILAVDRGDTDEIQISTKIYGGTSRMRNYDQRRELYTNIDDVSADGAVTAKSNRVCFIADSAENANDMHRIEFWEGTTTTSKDANMAIRYDGGPHTDGGDGSLVIEGSPLSGDRDFLTISRSGHVYVEKGKVFVSDSSSGTSTPDKTTAILPNGACIDLINTNGTTNSGVSINAIGLGAEGRYGSMWFQDTTSDNSGTGGKINFGTASSKTGALTRRMTIEANGNVVVLNSMRVGSDGTPSATLHVDGDLLSNDLILSNLEKDTPNEVDGTRGHWCIQEGAEDLFIINRQTGKKYKFNLSEVQ